MNTRTILFTTVALALLAGPVAAQTKIALIDMTKVFEGYYKTKAAKGILHDRITLSPDARIARLDPQVGPSHVRFWVISDMAGKSQASPLQLRGRTSLRASHIERPAPASDSFRFGMATAQARSLASSIRS